MNKERTIKITKMQGLGNDFVILDYSELQKVHLPLELLAVKLCDRHFGIGADGLIIPRELENQDEADISWLFYNSDGTVAQMCGNGIRCFAKYVRDKKLIKKDKIRVSTLAGIIIPEIQEDGTVRVQMSKPVLNPCDIPYTGKNVLNETIKVQNRNFKFNAVSMGNPHCVIFTDGKEDLLNMAKTYGPEIEKSKIFPEKTNVEFAHVISRKEIDMRVYERGCGITLACGTGACATTVAAILNNLTDKKVKVNLLGGTLTIEWQGSSEDKNQNVYMTGPAEYTFSADYIL